MFAEISVVCLLVEHFSSFTQIQSTFLFSSLPIRHVIAFDFSLFCTVPPMMMIQNQLVGAAIGQNVTLECTSEAFPKSINFWMRDKTKNDSIITSGKFQVLFHFHIWLLFAFLFRGKIGYLSVRGLGSIAIR